jgi:hypothetical protein
MMVAGKILTFAQCIAIANLALPWWSLIPLWCCLVSFWNIFPACVRVNRAYPNHFSWRSVVKFSNKNRRSSRKLFKFAKGSPRYFSLSVQITLSSWVILLNEKCKYQGEGRRPSLCRTLTWRTTSCLSTPSRVSTGGSSCVLSLVLFTHPQNFICEEQRTKEFLKNAFFLHRLINVNICQILTFPALIINTFQIAFTRRQLLKL